MPNRLCFTGLRVTILSFGSILCYSITINGLIYGAAGQFSVIQKEVEALLVKCLTEHIY